VPDRAEQRPPAPIPPHPPHPPHRQHPEQPPRPAAGPRPGPATGPIPRISNTGPIPRVTNTGPIPRISNTGPIPRITNTGPIPLISSTGPIPRVSNTGPMPRITNTGPIPRVSSTGPMPRLNATGPQRTLPPGAAAGDMPGYEFETRHLRRPSQGQRQGGPPGDHPARARGTGNGFDPSEPRRFRYTPTVSSGPAQDWPEDRPGFEFDGPFPAAHRRPRPATSRRPPSGPRPRRDRPASGKPTAGRPAAEQPAQSGNEWTRLLRSFLPQPERPSIAKEFKANLNFRGWALRVGVPIMTMIAVGIAVVVIVGAHSTTNSPAPGATALGFPPATLAGHDFTASPSTRGLAQSLGRVAADGSEVVAVGGQSGGRIARAQFFFSHNGGGSWSLASESVAGGGPPPPGHAATLIAGGGGNWVALGPDAIWVSGTGEAWTLVSTTGLPAPVTVLHRTSTGFIAVGANDIFVSANGVSWQRVSGPAGALDFKYLATSGGGILLAGEVNATKTIAGHPAVATVGAAWLSRDGGQHWTPVAIPAGHGATAQIAGVASMTAGFVAVRPATQAGVAVADVYRSADGAKWAFATTLGTGTGFIPGVMNGGTDGAVITGGSATGNLVAFVSAQGSQWQRTGTFGQAAGVSVSGAASIPSGAVVTAVPAGGARGVPAIKVLMAGAGSRNVSLSAIPGAVMPQVATNAVAAHGNAQVAVGSANGYPAAWMSVDGGSQWSRDAGETPAVFERPGEQQLTSVAFGGSGWVAVGGVVSGAPQHPVVVVSADGGTWAAADSEQVFTQGGLFTEQVAAGPNGYIVVGYQQTAGGRMIAAAWWSAGLDNWARSTDAVPGALDGAGDRQMLAVTATTDGYAAVGRFGDQPAAWVSVDGRQWRGIALPVPSGASRAVLLHVTAAGKTVVAVGMKQTQNSGLAPFAARSVDGGATWTETALPVPSGVAQVTALATAGDMFTATGSFGATPGHQDVVVWTSSDGLTWKASTPGGQGLTGPGIQAITGLTVSGSTLTGVGFTASLASEQPLFWQSPIRR
jgi:hypothetical protein